VTGGRGWFQEYGKSAQKLLPGAVVNIPFALKSSGAAANEREQVGILLDYVSIPTGGV